MKNIYEVKTGKFTWQYVLADSVEQVSAYAHDKKNHVCDWRMVGMLSREEAAYIRATAKAI